MSEQENRLYLDTSEKPAAKLLSAEEIAYAHRFAETIDVTNIVQILQYGDAARKRITAFSDTSLRSLPSKDLDAIAEEMKKLIPELQKFERDFNSSSSSQASFMIIYDRIERKVIEAQRQLEMHRDSLLRHVKQLENTYARVVDNIREFDLYILAGQLCVENCRNEVLPRMAEEYRNTSFAYVVQDYEEDVNRLEKKLEELQISRQLPISTLSQIRVIQNNDALMAENLMSLITNVFPLWKERMILALGLRGAGTGLDGCTFRSTNGMLVNSLNRLIRIQDNALAEREKMLYVIKSSRRR